MPTEDQQTEAKIPGVQALSVASGSAFRVKLLQLWIIPMNGSQDWGGIWETIGVREMNSERESWSLRRVMATDRGQPLEESRWLPRWLLLDCCRCVKLQTLFEPNK